MRTAAGAPCVLDAMKPKLTTSATPERRVLLQTALALALPAGLGLASAQVPARRGEEVPLGQPLREALMRGLNGPDRKLSAYRGRPLVINVWASWCGPCRAEMASLERLAWQEMAVPFAIIGISTDDYPDRAMKLLKGTNATISHYIDRELELESMLGATHLPLTVLVDAKGRVVRKIVGAKAWDSAEAKALIREAFTAGAALRSR